MLNINFASLNSVALENLNTFLASTIRIDEIETEYAPKLADAKKAIDDATATLTTLTVNHASKVWCDARDALTLAEAREDALKKALRSALKDDRKAVRTAVNMLAPEYLYIAYTDAIAKGNTADLMTIVSNWLTSLGLKPRKKDRGGWAGAVGDMLMAMGIKNRNLDVKVRSKSAVQNAMVTMLLYRGICTCGAFDVAEDGSITLHDFSKGSDVTVDIDVEQYMLA